MKGSLMARQAMVPVEYANSLRKDAVTIKSSGYVGRVIYAGYAPLLPGDSASGKFGIDLQLAEMPKPLQTAVWAKVHAWCVPKQSMPQFSNSADVAHSMYGTTAIKALGQPDRTPAPYFISLSGAAIVTVAGSEMFRTLGLHVNAGMTINSDVIDAFVHVYNFRLSAYSKVLPKRPYALEDLAQACTFPPAPWPSVKRASMVPDYDQSILMGAFDLDFQAGTLNVTAINKDVVVKTVAKNNARLRKVADNAMSVAETVNAGGANTLLGSAANGNLYLDPLGAWQVVLNDLTVALAGKSAKVTLADIDKARTTKSMAQLATAYAGHDFSGYDQSDAYVAMLLQGVRVGDWEDRRPYLVGSATVPVNFVERFATDAANLDDSVTTGHASALINVNVPRLDAGGMVVFTVEVCPERLDERMADPFLEAVHVDHLPNALRDIQRPEPVDLVLNKRIDVKHSAPDGLYAYEPMNAKWQREFTRLGGVFYQATPGAGWSENRAAIWSPEIVNPAFTSLHYLAPYPFPQDVFSVPSAPGFEFTARHDLVINGITQIGDILPENNGELAHVQNAG